MATLDGLTFEFQLSGAWVDCTADVMADAKYILTRGETDEYGRLRPGALMFSLRNTSGTWSNDNPSSAYFGLLVPGVPVRVSRGSNVRCLFQVRAWPQEWHFREATAYVPIRATGLLDALTQGQRSLESPVHRDVMRKHNDVYRLAYWSLEEGASATRFASPMGGVLPMFADNFELIDLAGFESPGSRNLPVMASTARLIGTVPTHASTNAYKIVTLWNLPGAITDATILCRLEFTSGTLGHVDLTYGTGGSLRLVSYDSGSTLIDTVGPIGFAVDGTHFLTSIELTQSGANVTIGVLRQTIDATNPSAGSGLSSETYAYTMGRLVNVLISPFGTLDGVAVGHVGVSNAIAGLAGLADATVGHVGEPAGERFSRLLTEEGHTAGISAGSYSLTEPMGIQGRDTLINILNECLTVDQGAIRETRDTYALTFVPGYTMYNQGVSVALDYDQGHFYQMPQSTTDDFLVHNDVTARQPDGGFARYAIESGRLSVSAPPDGIGTYDRGPVTANVEDNDQLPDLASFIANVRSPLDRRWHKISIELAREDVDANLYADMLDEMLISRVVSLANMPLFVAPETHYAIVRGWKETGDKFTHTFEIYTTPYWPYEVEPVETSGSTLTIGQTAGSTSWLLATSSGPLWDTTYEPYHIQATGEAVRVTTMADNTASFIGAGTADHDDNASLTPTIHASTQAGDALFLFAAIRNSGTGAPATPTGWSVVADLGNAKVFGKYYDAATVAPTVTFTSGVAGATTSAVILTYRGLSLRADQGRYLASNPSPQSTSNASAQNIAYNGISVREPGSVVLVFAWKQDDYTSVAPATGFTEAVEASSTTGDDQSLYVQHQIMGATPSDVFADTLVVTGGAAAISKTATIALRITQTATVVRGVNGVNVAQAAGAAVTTWRLGVNSL